jgi:limonene-1,2-epoxide hydrolase
MGWFRDRAPVDRCGGRALMVSVQGKALTALAALTLLLAGCTRAPDVAVGSASPAEAVAAFMHALGDKNADAACSQVSTGGQPLTNAGYDQCKEGLQKVLADLDDPGEIAQLKSATVTGASVNGAKATVTKEQISNVPAGYENDIDLVTIHGRWYIDSKQ